MSFEVGDYVWVRPCDILSCPTSVEGDYPPQGGGCPSCPLWRREIRRIEEQASDNYYTVVDSEYAVNVVDIRKASPLELLAEAGRST